jgi:hypothetical protein
LRRILARSGGKSSQKYASTAEIAKNAKEGAWVSAGEELKPILIVSEPCLNAASRVPTTLLCHASKWLRYLPGTGGRSRQLSDIGSESTEVSLRDGPMLHFLGQKAALSQRAWVREYVKGGKKATRLSRNLKFSSPLESSSP